MDEKRHTDWNAKSTAKILKETIEEELKSHNLKPLKVILFGSRARGNNQKHSDWDILIVTKNNLPRYQKLKLVAHLRKSLLERRIRSDIIITSLKNFRRLRSDTGSIIYYASKEGKKL